MKEASEARVEQRCTGQHGKRGGGLPVAAGADPVEGGEPRKGGPPMRRSRTGRWRAAVLIGVHVAIVVHIGLWLLSGRQETVSPVEPSESMYTLELGQINAGFVFFAVAILSTLIFGRLFCGWGCHLVALQDLCGWIMKKLGVRPKPFRSRLLVWAPLVLALYMFVWPTVKRVALFPVLNEIWPDGVPLFAPVPAWNGFSDHMVTADFWATFPPWFVAVPYFLIVGFAAVYFLGAKGFCTYGCPYGGFFGLADRYAPGQIKADLSACEGCGHCTATCTSNVQIHREIQVYERVVDPGCMKCMDCVSVCPNDALSFGFAKPIGFDRKARKQPAPKRVYDLSRREEWAFGAVFLLSFLAWRGVYGVVPMLLAIGLAGIITFLLWKVWRLMQDDNSRLYRFQLKREGRLRAGGVSLAALGIATILLTVQSGLVTFHHWRAKRLEISIPVERAPVIEGRLTPDRVPAWVKTRAQLALERYRRGGPLAEGGVGFLPTPGTRLRRAWLHLILGEREVTMDLLREELAARGGYDDGLIADIVQLTYLQGRTAEALQLGRATLDEHPDSWLLRRRMGEIYLQVERMEEARNLYREVVARHPEDAGALAALGGMLLRTGDGEGGLAALKEAVELEPDDPAIRSDYALGLQLAGSTEAAVAQMEIAVNLDPNDEELYEGLIRLYRETGQDLNAAFLDQPEVREKLKAAAAGTDE